MLNIDNSLITPSIRCVQNHMTSLHDVTIFCVNCNVKRVLFLLLRYGYIPMSLQAFTRIRVHGTDNFFNMDKSASFLTRNHYTLSHLTDLTLTWSLYNHTPFDAMC